MIWEYSTYHYTDSGSFGSVRGEPAINALLEQRGSEGWELATTFPFHDGQLFVFKKPAETASPARSGKVW